MKGPTLREIVIRPIGKVRNSIRVLKRKGWESVVSEIVLEKRLQPALDGVEDYSHLFVLFWLGRIPAGRREMMKVHPKSREDLPLVGVFATRTQYRPNPIGLTLVRLLSKDENILHVQGLDAMNGTSVLDVKPISPAKEFPQETRVPGWYHKLWKARPRGKNG